MLPTRNNVLIRLGIQTWLTGADILRILFRTILKITNQDIIHSGRFPLIVLSLFDSFLWTNLQLTIRPRIPTKLNSDCTLLLLFVGHSLWAVGCLLRFVNGFCWQIMPRIMGHDNEWQKNNTGVKRQCVLQHQPLLKQWQWQQKFPSVHPSSLALALKLLLYDYRLDFPFPSFGGTNQQVLFGNPL